MSVKVSNAIILMCLVLVVGAFYQAEAYGNCLAICRDYCQKMKPDPKACARGCYKFCQADDPRPIKRRLLRNVNTFKRKP